MAVQEPIAIVGMAVMLPGAPDLESYWRNLVDGVDAITEAPAHRWDPAFYDPAASADRADRVYCRRGGFIDDLAEFDPTRYGIMPNSVAGTEPDQLIALQVAASAIADAGGPDRLPAADRVGVVVGRGGYLTPGLVRLEQRVRTVNQLVHTLHELLPDVAPDRLDLVRQAFSDRLGPHQPESAIGLVPNLAASRIANRLDLRGPAYTVDAACASSLIAVDHAVAELATGRCDAVLAGGTHHCHDITFWSVFAQLKALSKREQIRPFDRGADGILIGEGTGVVVLKRLADATRDGDRVYAVVRGTGVSSDGRSASLFNPEPSGQAMAVRRAWAAAGLDPTAPQAIGLLEAHGTATQAGDTAELATVADVFGTNGDRAVIGSVKSMIGHTMPAAGIAGLVKAALAVHRGVLLPTLHCEDPRPELAQTRFRPIGVAQPWEGDLRRAGVNAFGFGGINAHVVLEQAPAATGVGPISVSEPERVLQLAAADPAALAEMLSADDATVLAAPMLPGPCRLGIVAPTVRRLALARRVVAKGVAWRGRSDIWFTPRPLLPAGRTAFVFPGLEADFAPRIDDVAAHFGLSTVEHSASNVGRHGLGVFSVGRLLADALNRLDIHADAVAGHSVGEWTAMVNAGLFAGSSIDGFLESFDPDSVQVPGLVFAAIGAGADRVAAAIAELPGVVVSHDNSPNQSIVCGPQVVIGELVRTLRQQNVLCQVLPFQSGFHTPMLAPYLEPIRHAVSRFELRSPTVPVWSATTASPFPAEPAAVREIFLRHLLEPVRFRALVGAMYEAGVRIFLQVGTGQLASVIGDTLAGRDYLAVAANAPQHGGLAQLRRVVTALWVEGATVDATALDARQKAPGPSLGSARAGRPVRLDLGGALLSLGDGAHGLVSTDRAPSTLDGMANGDPLAAELAGLLRETADSAVAALALRDVQKTEQQPTTPTERESTVHVSVDGMPYLRDHCFFRQRDDWPEITDRWPVVPATTVIAHMIEAAESAGPRAIAVHNARFARWVVAAPAVDVPVTVRPETPARMQVSFGPFAQSTIELGDEYPAAPQIWQLDLSTERAPDIVADQLYTDHWMFHGPQFQGVVKLTGLSDAHVRGVLRTPAAPGALLDNVGQLLGYWIMTTQSNRNIVFPVGVRRIRFYGPHPPAGEELDCVIAIRSITDAELTADIQLCRAGRVWAELDGWVDRRFDSHPETRAVERFPDRNTLSCRQPGDWTLVFERWPDLASRDLIMRNHLAASERADYDRCGPRVRRQWLLGRIAAKDAVRQGMWAAGEDRIFPAEVAVSNADNGQPLVAGAHGRALPDFGISIAHCAEAGVAFARRSTRVGIDIEEIAEHPGSAVGFALSEDESALMAGLSGEPHLWFTRFWTAKEAVAKAEGTGLRGAPQRFAVVSATESALTVEVDDRRYEVSCTTISNPPDLPPRDYVVAWTCAPATEADREAAA